MWLVVCREAFGLLMVSISWMFGRGMVNDDLIICRIWFWLKLVSRLLCYTHRVCVILISSFLSEVEAKMFSQGSALFRST